MPVDGLPSFLLISGIANNSPNTTNNTRYCTHSQIQYLQNHSFPSGLNTMKVAIIGGGPSGLATLKFLSHAHEYFPIEPITPRLFEADARIGGTFVQRVYEDAELVSSKYLTAFSDFRLPRDAPDFVTPGMYVKYLNDYATEFRLWDKIELGTKVLKIRENKEGHVVEIEQGGVVDKWECDAVAICSGLHMNPSIPDIEGLDRVPLVLHSSQLKSRQQFGHDTNVIVLGAGETGMDMAHLAVTSATKSTAICHNGGFFCAPKIIPLPRSKSYEESRKNKPVDTSVASLFDTAYVHPLLQRSPLLWLAYDQWIKKMHTLISGTEEGPDQWVGHMSKERKHVDAIFLCKSDRALPYISTGHRSQSWWNEKRSKMLNVPIKDTQGRKIDVLSWPQKVDEEGFMTLHDDAEKVHRIKPDVVVLATGYETKFPFLDDDYPNVSDTDVRCVYNSNDVSVGFIGFVRPSIGAIPPLAELQAQFWVFKLIQNKFPCQTPAYPAWEHVSGYEMDWKIHARAGYDLFVTKRAVDHEAYAYQLALDMGAAPTISYVATKGWKVMFAWAMGSNFNPKFRLVGPWKSDANAAEVMRTELYDVVKRSGGFVYLFSYTIVPFVCFGVLSCLLHGLDGLVWPFKKLGQSFQKKEEGPEHKVKDEDSEF